MISIKPARGRLLILRDVKESISPGGIVLTELYTPESPTGRVVSLGLPDYDKYGIDEKYGIEINDIVIFNKSTGQDIEENNIKYIVIKYSDVIGIIRN